jgi:hypothetical protein
MENLKKMSSSYVPIIGFGIALVVFVVIVSYLLKSKNSVENCVNSTFSEIFQSLLQVDLTNNTNVIDFQQKIENIACSTSTSVNIQIKEMLTNLLSALVISQNDSQEDSTKLANAQQIISDMQTQLSKYASQNCIYIVQTGDSSAIFYVALPVVGNWFPDRVSIPPGAYTGLELISALNTAASHNNRFTFTFDAKNTVMTMALKMPSSLQGFYCYEPSSTPSLSKMLHFTEPNITPSNQLNSSYKTTITSSVSLDCFVVKN